MTPEKARHKKTYTPLTATNLYRPSRLTIRIFNRFISQFIDKYNWGCINALDEKSFKFSAKWISQAPYISYVKLREKPRTGRYRDICLADHLEARQDPEGFVFYTSSIFSDLCLLCGDIDPIPGHGYDECLEALYYIRDNIFPGIYWEPSTTGRGIHFFLIFDFSTFAPYHGNSYDLFHRNNCNDVIATFSDLLSALIDSMFFCTFDKFCGTYPGYSFPFSSHTLLSRGTLGKLPCPQSDEDMARLSHIPILAYDKMSAKWDYMQELLDSDQTPNNPSPSTQSQHSPPYPLNILGRDFNTICKNDEKMDSDDAWERTIHSIMKLSRELGRIPEYEEWNEYYETNNCNTGEETEKRGHRFEAAVRYVEKTFDPSKIGPIYRYGDFIEDVRDDISEEEIQHITTSMTKYRYTITHQDLDIGLGAHWMAVRTHNSPGTELSVPRDAIPGLFKALKERGTIKRSCDPGKAKAIRTVLQQMQYIKLVDPYYCFTGEEHISQKWGMDIKFPKYNDYTLFCGSAEKMALRAKKMRDEGKENVVTQKNRSSGFCGCD